MKKLLNYILLLSLALCLSACDLHGKIQPLPQHTKVAVISMMGNELTLANQDSKTSKPQVYQTRINNFSLDQQFSETINRMLIEQHLQPIDIKLPENSPVIALAKKGDYKFKELSKVMKTHYQKSLKKQHIPFVILIVPKYVKLKHQQGPFGYGFYRQKDDGTVTLANYIAYNFYVIETVKWQVMEYRESNFITAVSPNSLWDGKSNRLSKSAQKLVKNELINQGNHSIRINLIDVSI